jgi:predicted nucleic acid-binding protein
MDRLVAADASPLIGLAAADAFDLLCRLFGTVTITRTVRDEVMAGGTMPGAPELDAAMREGWLRVAPAPMETWRFAQLGAGEASTIALALQHGGSALVLMDDALGREQANALGLEVTDLAGLLLAAKRARLIDAVRPLLERLAARGFTLPGDSVRAALAAAGEMQPRPRREPASNN